MTSRIRTATSHGPSPKAAVDRHTPTCDGPCSLLDRLSSGCTALPILGPSPKAAVDRHTPTCDGPCSLLDRLSSGCTALPILGPPPKAAVDRHTPTCDGPCSLLDRLSSGCTALPILGPSPKAAVDRHTPTCEGCTVLARTRKAGLMTRLFLVFRSYNLPVEGKASIRTRRRYRPGCCPLPASASCC